MNRVFAFFRNVLTVFVENRLLAEWPDADEFVRLRDEQKSDDPRMGGGPVIDVF